MNYILHYCRNKACNNGWIDEDLMNSGRPPSWKYCPDCVLKGKKNPKRKPIDPEVSERMKKLREAQTKTASQPVGINETLNENPALGISLCQA